MFEKDKVATIEREILIEILFGRSFLNMSKIDLSQQSTGALMHFVDECLTLVGPSIYMEIS